MAGVPAERLITPVADGRDLCVADVATQDNGRGEERGCPSLTQQPPRFLMIKRTRGESLPAVALSA